MKIVGRRKFNPVATSCAVAGFGIWIFSSRAEPTVISSTCDRTDDLRRGRATVAPTREAFFEGMIDLSRLSDVQLVKSPVGCCRDWLRFAAWADALARRLAS